MTRENLKDRVLDAVFGKRGTPAEQALAKAALPPRKVRIAFGILILASFCSILVTFLWSRAWLPFVESRISSIWFWSALALSVLLRFAVEQTGKRYERDAKAHPTESA